MQKDQAEKPATEAQDNQKPQDGDRLTSPIFIVSTGDGLSHKQYAVHEDILKHSTVLGRMCDGHFKEAHERHIVLPEDDPTDVGILVEYLYTRDFWVNGNPQANVSKQESAIKLAHVYLLADKYNLDGMKVVTTKKIAGYTNIAAVDDWLAVAEIIYAATPESDYVYPKFLRSLVGYFMDSERSKGKGCMDALQKGIVKGERLAVDIYRGSRIYSVQKERHWLHGVRQTGKWLRETETKHSCYHDECNLCIVGDYLDSAFPDHGDLKGWGVYGEELCDEDAIIDEESWKKDYKVDS
ncbi:MAG: hypothetical protein Q9225_006919 [Loekoesia sp. 1 TL-2023]